MFSLKLTLRGIPEIGFAHHFYTESYGACYGKPANQGMELVYVKSGTILITYGGSTFSAVPGSLFLLPRHLPFRLSSPEPQAHCSVQMLGDFSLEPVDKTTVFESGALTLPFLLPPGSLSEQLRRELYAIVSDLGTDREGNSAGCMLAFLGILSRLSRWHRQEQPNVHALTYRLRRYIAAHLHEPITLDQLSQALGKSPGYLNSLFRKETGVTLCQYINREKAQRIAEFMAQKGVSFETACCSVGIVDPAYGYRLFKKHMGQTPGHYLSGQNVRQ